MTQDLPQKYVRGRTKFKILWGFFSPPLLSFIFFPFSYLFVAECISLTSLAACVLFTWIALLLLNVSWLGVEKGIVCCCQSTRLQLWRILIAHPLKIRRWLLTPPARYIWRCLFFLFWEVTVQKTQHERRNWKTKSEFDSTKLLSVNPCALCNPADGKIVWSKRQKITKQTRVIRTFNPLSFYLLCSHVRIVFFSTTILCLLVSTPTELSA